MITHEFTTVMGEHRIFRRDMKRITRFDLDMIECPISIYVPFQCDSAKIAVRIKKAISELVDQLNEDFPTGV